MKKLIPATVRWFDTRAGEGFIRLDDTKESIYVHYSAIECNGIYDKDVVWRLLFKGQKVSIKVFRDSHYTQIEYVEVV